MMGRDRLAPEAFWQEREGLGTQGYRIQQGLDLLAASELFVSSDPGPHLERALAGLLLFDKLLFLDAKRQIAAPSQIDVSARSLDVGSSTPVERKVDGARVRIVHVLNGGEEQTDSVATVNGDATIGVKSLQVSRWDFESLQYATPKQQITDAVEVHVHDPKLGGGHAHAFALVEG